MSRTIVAVDLGGTHARFALATVGAGTVERMHPPVTLRTADHGSFLLAWQAFGRLVGRPLPRAAALSVAAPIAGEVLKLTNNPWTIRPALLGEMLDVDAVSLVNDFGAVGHAVAACGPEQFAHVCGPAGVPAAARVTSIVGPGTGLGVGLVVRTATGVEVIETEGGHVDLAPLDALDDTILLQLRHRFRRVSAERVVSGPGLANLHGALAAVEGSAVVPREDGALWAAALDGTDRLAAAALERWCMTLGAVAGDLALAHGAQAVVLAGGLGLRLRDHLPRSGFAGRFVAKGRFEARMAAIPVRLITHPEPGLLGAALAFARRFPG